MKLLLVIAALSYSAGPSVAATHGAKVSCKANWIAFEDYCYTAQDISLDFDEG